MKKFVLCGFVVALLLSAATPMTAEAATSVSQFFGGMDNLVSDNNAEYFIDLYDPSSRGSTFIDPGDLFIGSMSFNTIEDIEGGGGERTIGSGSVDELSAIFALKVLAVQNPGGIGAIVFAPVTAADTAAAVAAGKMSQSLKTELDSWLSGTMASVYNDPAQDYARAFNTAYPGPDDGDPGLTGADIGTGPFSAEEALLMSAYNWTSLGAATQVLELGFTGVDIDGDGAPNAALGEGWYAVGSDDVAVLRAVPPPTTAGPVNMGLNSLLNNTGWNFQPVATDPVFGGVAEFAGSSLIYGLGNANSPYDTFSNTDMVFHPIPEPASILLWMGLGVLGVSGSVMVRRKNRQVQS